MKNLTSHFKNKKAISLMVVAIAITAIIVFIGCSDMTTKDKIAEQKQLSLSPSYEMTIHEYVFYQYILLYDNSHYEETLTNHSYKFLNTDNTINQELAIEFIIENIHLFSDSLLYAQIVQDAKSKFYFDGQVPIAFTESDVMFTDYKKEHDGINIFQFDEKLLRNELEFFNKIYIHPHLNHDDINHYDILTDMMISNLPKDDIITFIEKAIEIPSFSQLYLSTLDFTLNNFRFHHETPLLSGLPAGVVAIDAQAKALGTANSIAQHGCGGSNCSVNHQADGVAAAISASSKAYFWFDIRKHYEQMWQLSY
jgi:tRNA-binding EMAP/Myf-like protein